jgi:hypothetical protein
MIGVLDVHPLYYARRSHRDVEEGETNNLHAWCGARNTLEPLIFGEGIVELSGNAIRCFFWLVFSV